MKKWGFRDRSSDGDAQAFNYSTALLRFLLRYIPKKYTKVQTLTYTLFIWTLLSRETLYFKEPFGALEFASACSSVSPFPESCSPEVTKAVLVYII